jgi:hypothetical protein
MANEIKAILTLVDNISGKLGGISTNFANFGKQVDSSLKLIGGGLAGMGAIMAVDKIKSAVEASISYGAAIQDNAHKMGITNKAYQEMDFIAKSAGTSLEGMSRGMRALTTSAVTNAPLIQKLGIATKDSSGNFLSANDIFFNTISRIAKIGNESERTAVTQKLFGRVAGEVLSIVNEGTVEIDRARETYHNFGLELSDTTIVKLHDARNAGIALDTAFEIATANVTTIYLPVIMGWMNGVNQIFALINKTIPQTDQEHLADDALKKGKLQVQLAKDLEAVNGNNESSRGDIFAEQQKKYLDDQGKLNFLLADEARLRHNIATAKPTTGAGDPNAEGALGKDDSAASQRAELELRARTELAASLAKADKTGYDKQYAELVAAQNAEIMQYRNAGADTTDLIKKDLVDRHNLKKAYLQEMVKDVDEDDKKNREKELETSRQELEDEHRMLLEKARLITEAAHVEFEQQKEEERKLQESREKMVSITMEMASSVGKAMGGMFGGQKDSAKKGLKEILDVMADYVEKTVIIESGLADMKAIGEHGVLGIALAALETGLIVTAGSAAKAAIASFEVGTRSAPGGLAYVHRDELINLPAQSQVFTKSETKNIMGGGGHTFHFYNSDGNRVESLRADIRKGGAMERAARELVALAGVN